MSTLLSGFETVKGAEVEPIWVVWGSVSFVSTAGVVGSAETDDVDVDVDEDVDVDVDVDVDGNVDVDVGVDVSEERGEEAGDEWGDVDSDESVDADSSDESSPYGNAAGATIGLAPNRVSEFPAKISVSRFEHPASGEGRAVSLLDVRSSQVSDWGRHRSGSLLVGVE